MNFLLMNSLLSVLNLSCSVGLVTEFRRDATTSIHALEVFACLFHINVHAHIQTKRYYPTLVFSKYLLPRPKSVLGELVA